MRTIILPLPDRPKGLKISPRVVSELDRIRFILDDRDDMAEFCWFAREYPRAYRHHASHAAFRLNSIYDSFEHMHKYFTKEVKDNSRKNAFSIAVGNTQVQTIYWDFESYLNSVSAALDVLARISGTAFRQHAPASFKDFCKKAPEGTLKDIFLKAQNQWAQGMKDYRDCFVHYTPVDTLLMVEMARYPDGWELRARLPSNPKAREILRFRWRRRSELLRYAIQVWQHFVSLDRAVALTIARAYRMGEYPQRTADLFRIGS
jgi:hypothetical protein